MKKLLLDTKIQKQDQMLQKMLEKAVYKTTKAKVELIESKVTETIV